MILKDKGKTKKVYIYEIEPVTFFNFSIDVQSNILNLYSEFLREFNLNFQIYISNKKINASNYIEKIKSSFSVSNNELFNEAANEYLFCLEEQLKNEVIHSTKIYLVVSLDMDSQESDILTVDFTVKKLDQIGCVTKRLKAKEKIEILLYESLNKEVVL